jgi:L,D-peptidoglycan transpeptidase YkuD (ErfK/YbiS/YcfS/YnhG family)
MHALLKNKKIYISDYKLKCSIGKRGIRKKIKEGDKITPKGTYKFKCLLYRKDRVFNIKTSLKKSVIKKNMGWCDDSKSKYYNKLIKLPSSFRYEKLYRKEKTYDLILVLNYNMAPIKKGKGSAIFIHVANKDYSPTDGCIGLNIKDLKVFLKEINKKSRIRIC